MLAQPLLDATFPRAQWNAEIKASLNAITYQFHGLTQERIAMVEYG